MSQLVIDISFEKEIITWEGTEVPMRDFTCLRKWIFSKYEIEAIIQESNEPIVTQSATNRMIKILGSNYQKSNLKNVVASAKHLTQKERDKLYDLLIKFQDIFYGTL